MGREGPCWAELWRQYHPEWREEEREREREREREKFSCLLADIFTLWRVTIASVEKDGCSVRLRSMPEIMSPESSLLPNGITTSNNNNKNNNNRKTTINDTIDSINTNDYIL